jgi:DnaK suppressor protein
MDPARARELLAGERARVERALRAYGPVESDEPTTTYEHLADQGSDLYEAELDEGIADGLRGELAAIERAERRLDAGTYGLSIESGEPISDKRLEAIPTAERTSEEQVRLGPGA